MRFEPRAARRPPPSLCAHRLRRAPRLARATWPPSRARRRRPHRPHRRRRRPHRRRRRPHRRRRRRRRLMSLLRHRHAAVRLPLAASARKPPLPSAPAALTAPRLAPPPPPAASARRERLLLLLLTVAALATRLYRLDEPAAVVFDEFHFVRFLQQQQQRRFVFDIHPWLAKLTHLLVATLLRVPPLARFDMRIGAPYPTRHYVLPSRATSALFGALCVPLSFLTARALRLSLPAAALAALLPLCDNLLLMQSRYVLLDSQLIFYQLLTLLSALRLWRLSRARAARARRRYYVALLATATAAAAALSVKWTAAVTPLLVAVVCAFGAGRLLRRPLPAVDALLAAVVAAAVYVLPWLAYLRVSVFSSPAAARMSDAFRASLRANASLPLRAPRPPGVLRTLYELHWRQFRANQHVSTRHPWESRWYEWPINARGLLFYINKAAHFSEQRPYLQTLYLMQNPAAALWVSAAVVSALCLLLLLLRYRALISPTHRVFDAAPAATFLCAGYVLNLVPYMFVQRCYFIYHYLPALTYGQLLLALLVDLLPTRVRFVALFVIAATTVAAFVHWSPWIYATPTTLARYKQLQWMPRWT